jgi:hypothetical protein
VHAGRGYRPCPQAFEAAVAGGEDADAATAADFAPRAAAAAAAAALRWDRAGLAAFGLRAMRLLLAAAAKLHPPALPPPPLSPSAPPAAAAAAGHALAAADQARLLEEAMARGCAGGFSLPAAEQASGGLRGGSVFLRGSGYPEADRVKERDANISDMRSYH